MTTQENMLARYKILHELGRGATGAVYAARERETGGVVALKRLDLALPGKPGANVADRFLKHVRSARLLRHRNIVAILDAGEVGGTVYVAMEMLEGESLRKILDGGPLPIARAIRIARDIACGLAHAHLAGVVHGGLKPSDIIVSRSGVAKITDFGAGQLGQAALLSGARAGSLSYLSPEQLQGGPVDHRCDIFALGALLYEMLAHRAPFGGGSAKEILENILHARPPLPSELNPHVPRALDGIVLSMLAGQAAARMPGVPILLRELQGLEEGLGLGSGTSAGEDEAPATAPTAEPEPTPQAPAPDRFRNRGIRNARSAPDGQTRDASGSRSFASSSPGEAREPGDRATDGEAFDYQKAIALMERESRLERPPGPRPSISGALGVVLALIGIGFAGFAYYSAGFSDRGIVASARDRALEWLADRSRHARADRAETARAAPAPSTQEAPAATQIMSRAIAPAPVADATQKPATVPAAKAAAAPIAKATPQPATAPGAPDPSPPLAEGDGRSEAESSSVSRPPEQPASARAARALALPQAKQPATEVPQQPRAGTARVILSVSPRGEIYIDGKHHGMTPPITTFDLEPGMHRIEVRSGSSTPYLTYVTLQTGDVRRIRHDFDVSRAVYPPKSASWKSRRAAR